MIDVISEFLMGAVSGKFMNRIVDDASKRLKENIEEMTRQSIDTINNVVPPIIYSALFFASGAIILILGLGTYVDSVLGVQGAGAMIGGCILLLLGAYYKNKMNTALYRVKNRK